MRVICHGMFVVLWVNAIGSTGRPPMICYLYINIIQPYWVAFLLWIYIMYIIMENIWQTSAHIWYICPVTVGKVLGEKLPWTVSHMIFVVIKHLGRYQYSSFHFFSLLSCIIWINIKWKNTNEKFGRSSKMKNRFTLRLKTRRMLHLKIGWKLHVAKSWKLVEKYSSWKLLENCSWKVGECCLWCGPELKCVHNCFSWTFAGNYSWKLVGSYRWPGVENCLKIAPIEIWLNIEVEIGCK